MFSLICALNKQSRGWWFETPSRSLWRHGYGKAADKVSLKSEVYKMLGKLSLPLCVKIAVPRFLSVLTGCFNKPYYLLYFIFMMPTCVVSQHEACRRLIFLLNSFVSELCNLSHTRWSVSQIMASNVLMDNTTNHVISRSLSVWMAGICFPTKCLPYHTGCTCTVKFLI